MGTVADLAGQVSFKQFWLGTILVLLALASQWLRWEQRMGDLERNQGAMNAALTAIQVEIAKQARLNRENIFDVRTRSEARQGIDGR